MNLTVDDLYRIIAELVVENWALKRRVMDLTPKPEPQPVEVK